MRDQSWVDSWSGRVGGDGAGQGGGEAGSEDREQQYREQIRRDLPRNYAAHLLHGLLGQTGFRLVNAPTFLPAYVLLLSGSEFVVGLARAIQYLGMFLSPLIGASLIEHRRRVLPIGFLVGGLMRLQVLGLALAGLWLSDRSTVVSICVFLGFFGFFMGMQGVIFNYLMSKVIPVERRGSLAGLRNTLAGLTAAVVAYLGGRHLVEPNVLGNGYAVTFLLAFGLTSIGLSALLLIREPEPPEMRRQTPLRERLRDVPELLRSDPPYAYYLLCRGMATMGRMAAPFYVLHAGEVLAASGAGEPGLSGAVVGILSTAFIAANSASNFVWGAIADRTGFRLVFVLALGVWILAGVGMLISSGLPGFSLAFVGVGAGMGGYQLAAQNMVLEFGDRSDLPVRIALGNSAQEFVGFLGPLIGGAIAAAHSKPAIFYAAMFFQGLAIALVFLRVDEPRHRDR